MKFVAPQQATAEPELIVNTAFWPDLNLADFRSSMRLDGTVTAPRLRQVMLTAIAEVNAELCDYRQQQQRLGFLSLADVPAEQLDGESVRVHYYLNAIWCWARAVLNERYQDFDATAAAVKRGEAVEESSHDLWRDARWAISRVKGISHNTVELI